MRDRSTNAEGAKKGKSPRTRSQPSSIQRGKTSQAEGIYHNAGMELAAMCKVTTRPLAGESRLEKNRWGGRENWFVNFT